MLPEQFSADLERRPYYTKWNNSSVHLKEIEYDWVIEAFCNRTSRTQRCLSPQLTKWKLLKPSCKTFVVTWSYAAYVETYRDSGELIFKYFERKIKPYSASAAANRKGFFGSDEATSMVCKTVQSPQEDFVASKVTLHQMPLPHPITASSPIC